MLKVRFRLNDFQRKQHKQQKYVFNLILANKHFTKYRQSQLRRVLYNNSLLLKQSNRLGTIDLRCK